MKKIKPLRKTPPNHLIPFLERWQSNNSKRDLGIARFVFDLVELNRRKGYPVLIRDFKPKYGVAPWAVDALYEYFIYEPGMTKEDRCHVFATYREGSKTSWFSFFLPLYETLVGQYGIYFNNTLFPEVDYQVLKGKTGKEAKKRLLNISNFLNKPIILDLFGDIRPSFKDVKNKTGKDQSDLLILKNQYVFEAAGIDQPIRGFNTLQMRPKKVTYDDPENSENTKTENRRETNRNEVMQEAFGAVSEGGTIIYIGNKIHMDDTIGKLLDPKNKQWKKQFHTLTYRPGPNGEKLPGKGNLDIELPDWPLRDTIEKIRRKKEWYAKQPEMGGVKGFLKEYYNIIKSDVDYKIREFHGDYLYEHNINWLKVYTDKGVEYRNVNIYIGIDPAISTKKTSSDASISAVAVDAYHRRYVLDISKGKYDIHDRFPNDIMIFNNGLFASTPNEISQITRIGSCEEVIRMYLRYNAQGISIETYGQQATFFNETKVYLNKLGKKPTMLPYSGVSDSKENRLRQIPLVYFESGQYYIKDDLKEKHSLKTEVQTFPHSKLDTLDSIHIAEQLITIPKNITYDSLGMFLIKEKDDKRHELEMEEDVEPWITA